MYMILYVYTIIHIYIYHYIPRSGNLATLPKGKSPVGVMAAPKHGRRVDAPKKGQDEVGHGMVQQFSAIFFGTFKRSKVGWTQGLPSGKLT
jgi:hypothetical protein